VGSFRREAGVGIAPNQYRASPEGGAAHEGGGDMQGTQRRLRRIALLFALVTLD